MGLNSGEVVVGKIGDDLRMDYTALAHTANLTARMEQIAEPERIYLAEATAHMCQGFFLLRDLGRHEVRGLSQPVGVFELEGAGRTRTRLEVSRARGFSKVVGRGHEMAALEAALARVIAGNAQVVRVVAEPAPGRTAFATSSPSAAARGRSRYTRHTGSRTGRPCPFSRSSSCNAATSASPSMMRLSARQDRRADGAARRDTLRRTTRG